MILPTPSQAKGLSELRTIGSLRKPGERGGVGNDGTAGPERPTPFERLLNVLPLPYPVAPFVLAIVTGAPGFILVEYARSSNWDQSLRLVFSQPGGVTWEGVVSSILFVLVDFLIFIGIASLRNRLVAAKEYFVALAPDGEATYRRVFRAVSSWWPAGIALALEGVSAVSNLSSGAWESQGLFFVILEGLRYLLTFGIITFVWVYAAGLKGLHDLGKLPLRLKSYHEDPLLGTRPIGQISLRFAFSFFAVMFLVLVANILIPEQWTFVIVAVFSIIGVTMFFLPLSSIHRRMAEVKGKETRSVRARFARLMGEPEAPDPAPPNEPFAQLEKRLRELAGLQVLDMEIRETGAIRTWPYDTRILGQLTVIILSVTAALIARVLVVTLPGLK